MVRPCSTSLRGLLAELRSVSLRGQVVGRYYSPRTIQLDASTVGTVYVQGPQNPETEGVHFLTLPLAALSPP